MKERLAFNCNVQEHECSYNEDCNVMKLSSKKGYILVSSFDELIHAESDDEFEFYPDDMPDKSFWLSKAFLENFELCK